MIHIRIGGGTRKAEHGLTCPSSFSCACMVRLDVVVGVSRTCRGGGPSDFSSDGPFIARWLFLFCFCLLQVHVCRVVVHSRFLANCLCVRVSACDDQSSRLMCKSLAGLHVAILLMLISSAATTANRGPGRRRTVKRASRPQCSLCLSYIQMCSCRCEFVCRKTHEDDADGRFALPRARAPSMSAWQFSLK